MSNVFQEVEKCINFYVDKWDRTDFNVSMLKKYNKSQQKQKQKSLDDGLNGLFELLNNLPEDEDDRKKCFKQLKSELGSLAKEQLNISNPDLEKKMFDGIMDVTEKFIAQARSFDSEFKLIDIMQAMRNVWIMNLIQIIAGKKIEYTPSIFAYSMLYPYTDNYLDSTEISDDAKRKFNARLSRRIKGEEIAYENTQEKKVFKLIEMIESQYPRGAYPDVYESILSIQEGQIKSLKQQTDSNTPNAKDVLRISAEKGGTSVLADAYLVCGTLDENMFEFAFGFGFVLQLIDDLQDTKCDKQNNHFTIFSRINRGEKFDELASNLISFVMGAIDFKKASDSEYINDIEKLITENCILMIFEAVSKNKKCYTKKYLKFAQEHSALSFNFFAKVNKKIARKMKALNEKDIFV